MQEEVNNRLTRGGRRLRWMAFAEHVALALTLGGGVCIVLLILRALFFLPDAVWLAPPLAALSALICLEHTSRGNWLERYAQMVDRCGAGKQCVTTAAHLLQTGNTSPAAMYVCRQALDVMNVCEGQHIIPGHRLRQTAMAVAIVGSISAALLLLPSAAAFRDTTGMAEQLVALPEAEQLAAEEAFRWAARQAPSPDRSELMENLAEAVRLGDTSEAKRLLEELRRAGIEPRTLLPEPLRRRTLGEGNGISGRDAEEVESVPVDHRGRFDRSGREALWVFHPGRVQADSVIGTQPDRNANQSFLPWDRAYDEARVEARRYLSSGRVPSAYVPILRRCFETVE